MIARIIDTNVLLDRPIQDVINSFEPCKIVIPFAVIKELDTFKTSPSEILRSNSRVASNYIDKLRALGQISEGVTLESGHTFKIEMGFRFTEIPEELSLSEADAILLKIAKGMIESGENEVIICTQDTNVRIAADLLGIEAENFGTIIDAKDLYTGWRELWLPEELFCTFAKDKAMTATGLDILENEYIMAINMSNPKGTLLGKYSAGRITMLDTLDEVLFGDIKAINLKQRFLVDALLNPSINLVTCTGPAGSGKTLLSLAAALHQNEMLNNTGDYTKLLTTRSPQPFGERIGYLPGGEDEKTGPWMRGILDNLDYITRNAVADKYGNQSTRGDSSKTDEYLERGIIEIQAMVFLRGRSIPDQFIIIDEAQNLTQHEVKTIITRVGNNSKIVLLGDIEQIDNVRLNSSNNGLVYAVHAFRDQKIAAHITLTDTERSALAELGAKLL